MAPFREGPIRTSAGLRARSDFHAARRSSSGELPGPPPPLEDIPLPHRHLGGRSATRLIMTSATISREAPVGLLLVNLGTPDAPDVAAVRRYLAEFLSDRRVVDLPRALWLPILYGVVLNTRPARSAKLYELIWNVDAGEGPLKTFTRLQAEKLQARIGASNLIIDYALRYGAPSIATRIESLIAKGCARIAAAAALPAICLVDHGLRRRRRLRRAARDAQAAGAPHRRALLRRPRLYRRARRKRQAHARRARFRTGGHRRVVSRPSAGPDRSRRSLSRALRSDMAAALRTARHERRKACVLPFSRALGARGGSSPIRRMW